MGVVAALLGCGAALPHGVTLPQRSPLRDSAYLISIGSSTNKIYSKRKLPFIDSCSLIVYTYMYILATILQRHSSWSAPE